MKKISIKFKKTNEHATVPQYKTDGASGLDLHSCLSNDIIIEPGDFKMIPTGISMEIPVGYEGQVRARSGLACKYGISVLNSPGTIDSDYRGEICVILINMGKDSYKIRHGDRIAQLVFAPVASAVMIESTELIGTKRNTGGFGHTGI